VKSRKRSLNRTKPARLNKGSGKSKSMETLVQLRRENTRLLLPPPELDGDVALRRQGKVGNRLRITSQLIDATDKRAPLGRTF
jgi:hypothetical protein